MDGLDERIFTLFVFIGFFLIFATVSNTLVLVVVCKTKKMKNVTNILICNLSASDVLLAAIVLPQLVHDVTHTEHYHEGKIYDLIIIRQRKFKARFCIVL